MTGLKKIETDQYMRIIDSDNEDKKKFNKIAGPGDEFRGRVAGTFLTNSEEMRKHLRKKKPVKSKSKLKIKKKCGCK
jgi:hypothetical protein